MRIIIECNCGNKIDLSIKSGKYIQFRDALESDGFCFDSDKNRETREFHIKCKNCKEWISIGIN